MRKNWGSPYSFFFFQKLSSKTIEFFCMLLYVFPWQAPKGFTTTNRCSEKKTVLQTFFNNFLIHFSWHWESKKKVGVTVLILPDEQNCLLPSLTRLPWRKHPKYGDHKQSGSAQDRCIQCIGNGAVWWTMNFGHAQSLVTSSPSSGSLSCDVSNRIKLPLKYCLSFFFTGLMFDLRSIHLLLVDRPELPWWKMGLWYSLPVFFVFNPLTTANLPQKWAFCTGWQKTSINFTAGQTSGRFLKAYENAFPIRI